MGEEVSGIFEGMPFVRYSNLLLPCELRVYERSELTERIEECVNWGILQRMIL